MAYMLISLAARHVAEDAKRYRTKVDGSVTSEQIAQAQQLVREWLNEHLRSSAPIERNYIMLFDSSFSSGTSAYQKTGEFYRIDEEVAVDQFLLLAKIDVGVRTMALEKAYKIVLKIPQNDSGNGAIYA